MKNSRLQHLFNHFGVVAATAVLFGGIGLYTLHRSAAYSPNPAGWADGCAVENGNTALYGWAWDPDTGGTQGPNPYVVVTVGGTSATVASSIAGYQDAGVNSWLTSIGAPLSGTYGWRLQLSGLYKGTSYSVSGTIKNDGTGADASLGINTSANPGSGRSYFTSSKTLPDACLVDKPTPAPTPTPAPKTTTPKAATPAPAPAAPTVSNAADATVTTGSATVTLSVPAGNAGTVYIRYGTDAKNLNRSSDIQTLSGAAATIKLDNLNGKTTYTYEIVRAQGTQTTTSPQASFTTKGYTLSLTFTDASGKPVKDISAQLGNAKPIKSDENGTVTFKNLGSGSYSPIFSYNGQSYSENFSTSSDGKAAEDGTMVLSKTIDLSKLRKTAQSPTNAETGSGSLGAGAAALLVFLLVLVGSGIWWAIRRKRRLLAEAYGYNVPLPAPAPVAFSTPASAAPEPKAVVHAVARQNRSKKNHEPVPTPAHMGESLRDMVLQSMAQESAQHPQDESKRPRVPGQR